MKLKIKLNEAEETVEVVRKGDLLHVTRGAETTTVRLLQEEGAAFLLERVGVENNSAARVRAAGISLDNGPPPTMGQWPTLRLRTHPRTRRPPRTGSRHLPFRHDSRHRRPGSRGRWPRSARRRQTHPAGIHENGHPHRSPLRWHSHCRQLRCRRVRAARRATGRAGAGGEGRRWSRSRMRKMVTDYADFADEAESGRFRS